MTTETTTPAPRATLRGKKAIVTGASRGIGRAIAEHFAAAGADVALLARDEAKLQEVAGIVESYGGAASVQVGDVLEPEAFRYALAQARDALGGADVLVNNAGGNSFSMPLTVTRYSGWDKVVKLNLDSTVHACQEILPSMVEQSSGSVINLASVAGVRGAPFMAHYGAAKAAVMSLTKSVAIEVAGSNVRVNALLPGWIETDLTDFLRESNETAESVLGRVPMHRWGQPEEIAAAAEFLASDQSSFMTGQELIIDGGLLAMP